MKKFVAAVAAFLLILAFSRDASAQLSNLKFGSYKITSINPQSLRSVAGTVQFACTNSGPGFTMSNITGTVYKKGVAFLNGYSQPVNVRSGATTAVVNGTATLCEGISLWDVLSCVAFNANDYTIDVSMTISTNDGDSRLYTKKGISVADILHNVRGK